MPVVNFSLAKGGCDVTLNGATIKADGASESLIYKIDVAMILASRGEAEQLEETLPGIAEIYDRAGESDNWKGTLAVKPADSLRVVLTAKEAGVGVRQGVVQAGGVIVQGTAELLQIKATQSKRARAVIVQLVFRGQGADVAERLADNLSRSVGMSFDRISTQTVLPFASVSAKPPTLRPGMIVAASAPNGEQVVGRLVEMDGDELSLQEAGTEITVSASDVISAFAFAQDGDTQAALSDYQERCERRELPVSWRALVTALGMLEGRAPASGVQVSADHVEAATRIIEASASPAQEETTVEVIPAPRVVVEIPAIPLRTGRRPRAAARA